MSINTVLYLHGFNSSPDSFKAQATRHAIEALSTPVNFIAPQLDAEPATAMAQIDAIIDGLSEEEARGLGLIGSSMGGFYATCAAEQRGIKSVALINPAVHPAVFAREWVDQTHVNETNGSQVVVEAHFVDQLREMEPAQTTAPERYLVMLGAVDEVLDYRQALAYYQGATFKVDPEGDHALESYVGELPNVLAHFHLS
ncbi:YqiA/YcfP family alpha/beta fold hydrolase [Carnimonas bestiolae]|uniref:YqiA/YcfP family alpha/beta fold hydrolase n=1 Tax=Carnimonas bestiolae TaxID=3402172 RepID=UPI003EDBEA2D